MSIETLAYWGAFVIPIVLLGVSVLMENVVSAEPLRREHFYRGMDLTIYFLAVVLANFLDIAKEHVSDGKGIIWTVILLLAAIVMLFIQMGLHQAWRKEEKKGKMQAFILCFFANALGILLLYGFVKLKTRGLL